MTMHQLNENKKNRKSPTKSIFLWLLVIMVCFTANAFGTDVGGIISTNTTWRLSNSPYTMIGDVQVGDGVTLTIEPGVVVNGNESYSISIKGSLSAVGTSASKIILNNVRISSTSSTDTESGATSIQYCEMNSGYLVNLHNKFILRDSKLYGVRGVYIYYPQSDWYIERNIFQNSDGISTDSTSYVTGNIYIYIKNNVFYQQKGDYAVYNGYSREPANTIVEYNSFLSIDRVALYLNSSSASKMMAVNNYWNTTDKNIINAMIYDKNDDLNIKNAIVYEPFLTSPHPNTPASPISEPVLTVWPISRDVPAAGETTFFGVANSGCGNMPWTAAVVSGSDWLSISSGNSATNSGTTTCTYSANTGTSARTAVIRITASGATESPKDLMVIQTAPNSGTTVSGIISTNTTWRQSNSPYTVIGEVQVASGVTLTIEPGVVVNGNESYSISIKGSLSAVGTSASKIILNNVRISSTSSTDTESGATSIQYCEMNSGYLVNLHNKFILRDSKLYGVRGVYIYYPQSDWYIERNIFQNSDGISTDSTSYVTGNIYIYIKNNVFYQQKGDYAVYNGYSREPANTIVEYNSFLSIDRVALYLNSSSASKMMAVNNYWNTTDKNIINAMIYDKNDDLNIKNAIVYEPFLTSPHSNTPPFTISEPVLSVSPSSRNVAATQGTTDFAVSNTGTGTMSWYANVISGSWLTITSGASGANAGTIRCSFGPNLWASSRSATIQVIASAGQSPQTITVTQAGDPTAVQPVLSVSPGTRTVSKDTGSTTFSVTNTGTGTMSWQAEAPSGGWLSITYGSSGNNTGTIHCTYTANTTQTNRTANIRITASGATGSPVDVTVTQQAQARPVLSVTPSNQAVSRDTGTTTFSVSNTGIGTMPWTAVVTPASNWLTITSGASGTNSGTISCSFPANTSTSSRTATIRVTAAGATNSPVDVTVTQAAPPVLSVTPSNRDVPKEAGSTTFSLSITGTATIPWTAVLTPASSWLTITSGASGTNSATITCTYNANTTTSTRIATIRVTAAATGSPVDVTVTQAGQSDLTISGSVKTSSGTAVPDVTITFSNSGGTAKTDSSGSYSIKTIPNGYSGTATPSKAGYTFDPASKTYSNVTADKTGENYTGTPTPIQQTLVPDTGQTKCYNNTVEIPCPSSEQAFFGQDANYTINPMSYTKLDGSGKVLPDSAATWAMVKDNVTGLIWENKTDDGTIHDKDNTYTWYNPTDPNPGTQGDGTDTKDFLDAMNSANFGGYSDWRLPTIKELMSIVNHGIPSPGSTIDTEYFPNTVSSYYWASSTYAYNTNYAWGVYFNYGHNYYNYKLNSYYVRAVRGGQSGALGYSVIWPFDTIGSVSSDDVSTATGGYADNGDGTVTDTSTGLMWQQQAGSSSNQTWEQALAYCEGLNLGGHTDWRLPTTKELRSLADYNQYAPAINATYFPNTVSSFYWSSTTNAYYTSFAWGVYFDNGLGYYTNKSSSYYVRAVRGGQSGLFANLVISPVSRTVAKDAGATTFSVSNTGAGTMPWTAAVTPVSSWLSITSGASGTNSGTITCDFKANTSTSARTATIQVTATGATGSPVDVTVTQAPTPGDDGDSCATATPITLSGGAGSRSGSLTAGDYDYFRVDVTSSGTLTVYTTGSTDTYGYLKNSDCTDLAYNDDSGDINFSISQSVTAGTYYVAVRHYSSSGTGAYTLNVTVTQAGVESLAASFAVSGLRIYNSGTAAWSQVNSANPENMIYCGSTLYAGFGTSYGLYKWDGAAWTQLRSTNPENMVTSGSTLYVDFGASYGLYKWDGAAWTQLTSANPENMVTSGSTLYVDFGASYGLYKWDGAMWTQLTSANPENMVTSGAILYVDFGSLGLYKWDGTAWTQLTSVDPENMVTSGATLYVNFGASYGLYKWDGAAWAQLTTANPENMVTSSGSALYVDFGALGIYRWDGTAWSQITGSNPVIMAVSN